MSTRILTVACPAVLAVLVAGPAAAQPGGAPPPPPGSYVAPPPPPPGSYVEPITLGAPPPGQHQHDGFYLRLATGVGFTHMRTDERDVTVSGSGGTFALALGAAITPNLIVYGEVFDDIAMSPDYEQNGQTLMTSDDVVAGVVGVGAGLAYYLTPMNVYFSATLAASKLTVQQDGEQIGESDFGIGISVMAGQEWWVSDNWGLGLAAQLFSGAMPDKNDGPRWATTAGALCFSATYN